jgi:hypothetical protein
MYLPIPPISYSLRWLRLTVRKPGRVRMPRRAS